jgi:predicted type IV restriction endonuclease
MTAPKEILQLVERFGEQREAYLNPHYNEAQLRQEFLNPFFKALGWGEGERVSRLP